MTYYDILQVAPTASPEVIQMAYKALAKKYHPDLFEGDKTIAEIIMKQLNEAHYVLSSPILRAEYDKQLRQNQQPSNTQQEHQAQSSNFQNQPQSSKKPIKFSTKLIIAIAVIVILIISISSLAGRNSPINETTAQVSATTTPKITTAPKVTPAAVVPLSGEIIFGTKYENASEITVTAPYNADCVVKLKNAAGSTRIGFYVRAGDTATVGVPSDHLYVYFATGSTWYGKSELFGKDTYYSKDDELLDFSKYTWEYTLTPVTSGNFSETPIDADEFN